MVTYICAQFQKARSFGQKSFACEAYEKDCVLGNLILVMMQKSWGLRNCCFSKVTASNQINVVFHPLFPTIPTWFFFSSTGAVSARIMLLKKKQARYQGVVCAMKVRSQIWQTWVFSFGCVKSFKPKSFDFPLCLSFKNVNFKSNWLRFLNGYYWY